MNLLRYRNSHKELLKFISKPQTIQKLNSFDSENSSNDENEPLEEKIKFKRQNIGKMSFQMIKEIRNIKESEIISEEDTQSKTVTEDLEIVKEENDRSKSRVKKSSQCKYSLSIIISRFKLFIAFLTFNQTFLIHELY